VGAIIRGSSGVSRRHGRLALAGQGGHVDAVWWARRGGAAACGG
jgi:hypothetical protein